MNTPKKTATTIVRHEWTIGKSDRNTDAKEFTFGIRSAQEDMKALGVDLSYDDCYHVRAGDGGEVVLYVDIEGESK